MLCKYMHFLIIRLYNINILLYQPSVDNCCLHKLTYQQLIQGMTVCSIIWNNPTGLHSYNYSPGCVTTFQSIIYFSILPFAINWSVSKFFHEVLRFKTLCYVSHNVTTGCKRVHSAAMTWRCDWHNITFWNVNIMKKFEHWPVDCKW